MNYLLLQRECNTVSYETRNRKFIVAPTVWNLIQERRNMTVGRQCFVSVCSVFPQSRCSRILRSFCDLSLLKFYAIFLSRYDTMGCSRYQADIVQFNTSNRRTFL